MAVQQFVKRPKLRANFCFDILVHNLFCTLGVKATLIRSNISLAALLVKVTNMILLAGTPLSNK
jgi:hypothetical protein